MHVDCRDTEQELGKCGKGLGLFQLYRGVSGKCNCEISEGSRRGSHAQSAVGGEPSLKRLAPPSSYSPAPPSISVRTLQLHSPGQLQLHSRGALVTGGTSRPQTLLLLPPSLRPFPASPSSLHCSARCFQELNFSSKKVRPRSLCLSEPGLCPLSPRAAKDSVSFLLKAGQRVALQVELRFFRAQEWGSCITRQLHPECSAEPPCHLPRGCPHLRSHCQRVRLPFLPVLASPGQLLSFCERPF